MLRPVELFKGHAGQNVDGISDHNKDGVRIDGFDIFADGTDDFGIAPDKLKARLSGGLFCTCGHDNQVGAGTIGIVA